jgi:dUTP pyrophosphatase
LKKEITITNTPGTVDENYTGNICVILRNLGGENFIVKKYDKIAQMIFNRVPEISLTEVEQLEETDRGTKGMGSSGV